MILFPKAVTYGLHVSLLIPIAAKSKTSIEKYVGHIEKVIGKDKGFILNFEPLAPPNDLKIWEHPRSALLNYPKQLWIDIDYHGYRKAYLDHFGDVMENSNDVVDHIMNRKLARNTGYRFVRLLHVSRQANSSSGRGGESYAVGNVEISRSVNPDFNASEVVHADPSDLLKMLNINVGGFGLDKVGAHHHWLYEP